MDKVATFYPTINHDDGSEPVQVEVDLFDSPSGNYALHDAYGSSERIHEFTEWPHYEDVCQVVKAWWNKQE